MTLRGSVIVLIKRSKNDVREDEKILKKINQKIRSKEKEARKIKFHEVVTEANGFKKATIQKYKKIWLYCKNFF